MPRFPRFSRRLEVITGSVFEKFRTRIQAQGDRLVGLHIGDSYAPPPYDLPFSKTFLSGHPGFNRYCDTFGVAALREALAEKLEADNNLGAGPDRIMMTAGACSALSISMQALVDPGDDVLLLSPYWPFFRGMVRVAGGRVIEAPFYMRLYDEPELDIVSYLDAFVTPNTTALYVNTPNNPSGKVLTGCQLQRIAEFARAHDLWVVSDEAYDGMTYDGHEHISIASLPGMFERTLSVFTFSKVYMFSGLRLGYVVATTDVLGNLNKIMVHQYYSPPTVTQQMMAEPVQTRSQWSGKFVEHFRELRDMFVDRLHIKPRVPEGTYYFFFPVSDLLNGRSVADVIDACFGSGVSVAPGEDFGEDFTDHIRLCFAGEPPGRLETAIRRLNAVFPG